MPPQAAATADIPPPPVLSQDQLRLMPGMKLNPVSPDLTGIARTEKFTAPNIVPSTPAVGTVPAGGVPSNVRANVGMTNATPDSPIRAQTVQYWIDQGVNPQAAEGIADALQPESGFNPAIYNPNDNGAPSGGIYQHHGERLERLQKYAASQGKSWTDPAIQHQFANLERQSGNPYTDQIVAQHWQEIANAPDRATAKALWQRYFERGTLQGGAGGANIPYANEQQAAAQTIQADLYGASDRARKQADGFMSEVKDFKKDLTGSLQRIHEARGRSDEAIAKATEATNYQPKPPLIDGFANLGSLGAIIGMMGGLLTKSPMIASLNAGAAAIEAANRGDMAQYERAYDSWKTNSDMLFKIVDLQQKRAQEIMGDEKFMTEEKRVGLDLYLRAIGQEQLADKLRIEGDQFAYDHFKTMGTVVEKYDENRIRLQETHEQHIFNRELQLQRLHQTDEKNAAMSNYHKAQEDYRQNHDGQNPPPEIDQQMFRDAQRAYPKQTTGAQAWKEARYDEALASLQQQWQNDPEHAGKEMSPDELESVRDRAAVKAGLLQAGTAKFLTDPKTMAFDKFLKEKGGNATSTEMMSFLQSQHTPRSAQGLMLGKFMQAYPNASPEDVRNWYINTTGMMSAERYFVSGRGEQVLRSFNVVADHLEIFRDVAREFAAGKFRLSNELAARFENQIGKAAPNNLQLAKTLLGDEIARAVIGGVGALADRTEIQDRLSRSNSWNQIEGVIDTAARFVGGQLHGLEQTWTNAGMDQLSPFETKLSPGARKLFSSVPETQGITYGGHAGAPPDSTPATGAQTWPTPSPAAIKALKNDPSLRQDFENTFGPENMRKYLGQ